MAALVKRKGYIWLPRYLAKHGIRTRTDSARPVTDVIVLVCDHFEPARWEREAGVRRVRDWCERYAEVAARHADSDGVRPQHTWFYRYDYPNVQCIRILSEYVYQGLGEIEFHLHHGYDTSNDFSAKIDDGVTWFNQVGAMLTAEETPQRRFAYIAGNWALDNGARDPSISGVDNEIWLLSKYGCYADFTFPAWGSPAQPRMVNNIYYATDTPGPKSYDTGVDVEVGRPASGDLMLVQGPLWIDWKRAYVEYAALETYAPYAPARIDYWLNAGVSVRGRPEWAFVKLHTHGMQSRESFLGGQLERLCADLESRSRAQGGWRLHYVTAREAYNMIKAAEAGLTGNAGDYRNHLVPPPANRLVHCNAPYMLKTFTDKRIALDVGGPGDVKIHLKRSPLRALTAEHLTGLCLDYAGDRVEHVALAGSGSCQLRAGDGERLEAVNLPYSGPLP